MFSYFRKIIAQNGIRGLWRGCWPNVQRAALVNLGKKILPIDFTSFMYIPTLLRFDLYNSKHYRRSLYIRFGQSEHPKEHKFER